MKFIFKQSQQKKSIQRFNITILLLLIYELEKKQKYKEKKGMTKRIIIFLL
jgi:hypothetical protein